MVVAKQYVARRSTGEHRAVAHSYRECRRASGRPRSAMSVRPVAPAMLYPQNNRADYGRRNNDSADLADRCARIVDNALTWSGNGRDSSCPDDIIGHIAPILDDVVSTTKNWWLLLVAGVASIVIAVVILRIRLRHGGDDRHAVRILGFVAEANEVMVGAVSTKGWRTLPAACGAVHRGRCLRVHPARRHVRRAGRVMSFYFIFRGSFDIAMAFGQQSTRMMGSADRRSRGVGDRVLGRRSWNVSVTVLVSWVARAPSTASARSRLPSPCARLVTASRHSTGSTRRESSDGMSSLRAEAGRLISRRLLKGTAYTTRR